MRNSILALLLLVSSTAFGQTNKISYVKAGHLFDSQAGSYQSDVVLVVEDQRIQSVQTQNFSIPAHAQVVDLSHAYVFPGLIDCHTHLVYAGNRAPEFEMRLAGASERPTGDQD